MPSAALPTAAGKRWRRLALVSIGVMLALATWYSAAAAAPELGRAWALSAREGGWLAGAVQLGFVVGAIGSSALRLPDRVPPPRLMTASALAAALANASLLAEPGLAAALAARFATGVALAGVYPPALKLVATWFDRDRGLALGILVGALAVGSALPHLLRGLGGSLDWRLVVGGTSLCAGAAALVFATSAEEGPYRFAGAAVALGDVGAVLGDRRFLLINLGYLGHMWELYAMWAWLLAFIRAAPGAPAHSGIGGSVASLVVFAAIAAGGVGCVLGGALADRIGRARTAALMMAASGSMAVAIGFAWDGPSWLLVAVALAWGVTVIADSAQFSALTTELGDRRLVGTALSLQLGLGFAMTVVSIWLVEAAASAGGWRWAFLVLAPGPFLGAAAMLAVARDGPTARPAAPSRRLEA